MSVLSACAFPEPGYRGYGMMKKGSFQQAPAPPPPSYVVETVEVRTDPPGARVLVNGSDAGYSPVTVTARRLWRGESGYQTLDTVKIEAFPVEQGQCVQTGIFGENASKAPPQVRFDMTKCGKPASQPQAQPVQPETQPVQPQTK
jgi:hypothetical protein